MAGCRHLPMWQCIRREFRERNVGSRRELRAVPPAPPRAGLSHSRLEGGGAARGAGDALALGCTPPRQRISPASASPDSIAADLCPCPPLWARAARAIRRSL